MSSVGNLVAAPRPEGGGRSDESWSDLELPGWQEFIGARNRFFEGLRRLQRPAARDDADAGGEDVGEGPAGAA